MIDDSKLYAVFALVHNHASEYKVNQTVLYSKLLAVFPSFEEADSYIDSMYGTVANGHLAFADDEVEDLKMREFINFDDYIHNEEIEIPTAWVEFLKDGYARINLVPIETGEPDGIISSKDGEATVKITCKGKGFRTKKDIINAARKFIDD